jgi:adenosine deaminase CECR1
MRTGGNIYLTPREHAADEILLRMKEEAVQKGIKDSLNYAPSLHFFRAKQIIDKDPLYEVIQKVPKGAVLHLHNSAGVSSEWVIKNLTYRDDLMLCTTQEGMKIFETV